MIVNLDKVVKIEASGFEKERTVGYLTFYLENAEKVVKRFETEEDLSAWITANLPENFKAI